MIIKVNGEIIDIPPVPLKEENICVHIDEALERAAKLQE